MKLVTYKVNSTGRLGIVIHNNIYDLSMAAYHNGMNNFPSTMLAYLQDSETLSAYAKQLEIKLQNGEIIMPFTTYTDLILMAPVPNPTSCRDGYAFRQHVVAARRNRKVDMIEEFDQYPIFYFTNHNAIQGPGEIWCMPDHFQQLDFELEIAIAVGKQGLNIKAADADNYIAGFMIMNDMSARVLQMEEMKLNLGPAKGKDFSTVIGPMLVTPDDDFLKSRIQQAKENHEGSNYNLTMTCNVNGIEVSRGNTNTMDWTFAEILERCAYGTPILPGDVIGSGTVGTGCFLELNGTGKLNDPNYKTQWLQEGDVVEMEIDGLGKLTNTIKKFDTNFSILALKKNV